MTTPTPEQPQTWPKASICECGLAKSYHPRPDHEYRPRWNCPDPSAHATRPEQDEAVLLPDWTCGYLLGHVNAPGWAGRGPSPCALREGHSDDHAPLYRLATPPPATPAALDVVRDLAALSVADSPEFRDPGWEDAVRALIRRARFTTPEASDDT